MLHPLLFAAEALVFVVLQETMHCFFADVVYCTVLAAVESYGGLPGALSACIDTVWTLRKYAVSRVEV